MTLSEFLLARYTEEENEARGIVDRDEFSYDVTADRRFEAYGDHIEAGVGRVTAGLEAKRQVVKRHHIREVSPSCAECGGYTATSDEVRGIAHHGYAIPWPCPTLRLLAAVYADHPDYREEWRA
jgi:hypothetical protein